jgi:hypothetical protein
MAVRFIARIFAWMSWRIASTERPEKFSISAQRFWRL